jgi:hypothetical protein
MFDGLIKKWRAAFNPADLGNIDLDADAERIRNSARVVGNAVIERRAALDRNGHADQPLLVLLGESHNKPGDRVHHIAVLDQVMKHETSVVWADETISRLTQKVFYDVTGTPVSAEVRGKLAEADAHGDISLKSRISDSDTTMANHSRAALFHALARRHVPTRFVDAQSENRRGRVAGMLEARNRFMFDRTVTFADEMKARIVFLRCGSAHVLGGQRPDGTVSAAADSLAGLAKKAGIPVLAVPILSGFLQRKQLPPDHGLNADELLPVESLPEVLASYSPDTGKALKYVFNDAALSSRTQEAAYLNGLLERLGLKDDALTIADYRRGIATYSADLKSLFETMRKEAVSAPPFPPPAQRFDVTF